MFDTVENSSQVSFSSQVHLSNFAVDTAFLSISLSDCVNIGMYSEEFILVGSAKVSIWDNCRRRQLYLTKAATGIPFHHSTLSFTSIAPKRFQELQMVPPPLLPQLQLLINPLSISGSFQKIQKLVKHIQEIALKIQACIEEAKYRCSVLDKLGVAHGWHWDPEVVLEYLPFPGHQIHPPGPLGKHITNNYTLPPPKPPTPTPSPPPVQRTPSPDLETLSEVWINWNGHSKLAIDLTGGEEEDLLYPSDEEDWDNDDWSWLHD